MQLHHIGIKTTTYEITKQTYIETLGYTCVKEIIDPHTGNIFCFLSVNYELPYIEIIYMPHDTGNLPTIHTAYQVQDIYISYDQLITQGYISILSPSPASMISYKAFLWMPDKQTVVELIQI